MKNLQCLFLALILTMHSVWAAGPTAGIIVHVTAADTEKPIGGAVVRIRDKAASRPELQKTTAADGTAEFDDLPVGDYTLVITEQKYENDLATVHVPAGKPMVYESVLVLKGKERVIQVRVTRILVNTDSATGPEATHNNDFMRNRVGDSSISGVANTTAGVAGDAVGQFHPRGEHKGVSVVLDGISLPIPNEGAVNQIIDPEFLSAVDIKTGMYDASLGGNLGAVLNMQTESGAVVPHLDLYQTVGTSGIYGTVAKASGSANADKLNYFVGARVGLTDLRVEAPTPRQQTLNNHGLDDSFLIHLHNNFGKDILGVTASYSNTDYGVPQTPQNYAAGVRQNQEDTNLLGLLYWKHEFSKHDNSLLSVAYLRGRQIINNNGVFTPFTAFPASISPDLANRNAPLDPTNPGSPYLPQASLTVTQIQPAFEYNYTFSDTHKLKAGLSADFIRSAQSDNVVDAGGGGGLPNPLGLPTPPTSFAANVTRSGHFESAYVSDTFKPLPFLTINAGIRADTFFDGGLVKASALTPRVNLAFKLSDTQVLRASYNRIFEPPPIEIDTSGLSFAVPQKTNQYEISYENQIGKTVLAKAAVVNKDFHDQVDSGLLIPNSNIPIYAPVNFGRAHYEGVELTVDSFNETGFNGFLAATVGVAKPTKPGPFDPVVPQNNDHDQRAQIAGGFSYTWKKGPTAAVDMLYASGYPLDVVAAYNAVGIFPYGLSGQRIPRFIANFEVGYDPTDAKGKRARGFGWRLKVENLFNTHAVLGFLSSFSGTRFVQQRRVIAEGSYRF